ncbi:hypothetical protein [Kiloniella majae]|uniref:hypothetical protein n=1 Tax=Kiloniella majae TaxID=1938558 RepID=UPI000A277C11|nr:hypothetical protein [Kiloniella majae]
MTHKPVLDAGQLADSKLGLTCCGEISNVSGLCLKVLEPEHSRTDCIERGPDAVGVVSHFYSLMVAALVLTMTGENSKIYCNSRALFQ